MPQPEQPSMMYKTWSVTTFDNLDGQQKYIYVYVFICLHITIYII